jgi:hypothetical protein
MTWGPQTVFRTDRHVNETNKVCRRRGKQLQLHFGMMRFDPVRFKAITKNFPTASCYHHISEPKTSALTFLCSDSRVSDRHLPLTARELLSKLPPLTNFLRYQWASHLFP